MCGVGKSPRRAHRRAGARRAARPGKRWSGEAGRARRAERVAGGGERTPAGAPAAGSRHPLAEVRSCSVRGSHGPAAAAVVAGGGGVRCGRR